MVPLAFISHLQLPEHRYRGKFYCDRDDQNKP